jgi:hypothetical protein
MLERIGVVRIQSERPLGEIDASGDVACDVALARLSEERACVVD